MTKLEFLDRINDILIDINTAESDALGSLYDELMRDAGWHPASELPPVDESGNSAELIAITCDNNLMKVYFHYESEEYNFWVESDDLNKQVKYGVNVKWWCYPPKEE